MIIFALLHLLLQTSQAAPGCTPTAFKESLILTPPMDQRTLIPRFLGPDQLLYTDSEKHLYRYDFKTQKSVPVAGVGKDKPVFIAVSPDNEHIVTISSDKKRIDSVNLKTGKHEGSTSLTGLPAIAIDDFNNVTTWSRDGTQTILNLPALQKQPTGPTAPIYKGILAKDTQRDLTVQSEIFKDSKGAFSTVLKVYSHSKLVRTITQDNGTQGIFSSGYENGSLIQVSRAMTAVKSTYSFTDLATGKTTSRKGGAAVMYRSRRLLETAGNWLVDPITGEKIAPADASSIPVAPGEKPAYCTNKANGASIFDEKTHALLKSFPGIQCYQANAYSRAQDLMITNDDLNFAISARTVCIDPHVTLNTNPHALCNLNTKKSVVDAMVQKNVCDQPYSDAMAKAMKIDPSKKDYSLSETETYLKFLSKPKAFQLSRDMNFMNAVLHSSYAKENPALVQDALAGILATSPMAYSELTLPKNQSDGHNFSVYTSVPTRPLKASKACLTASEEAQVQNSIKTFFKQIYAESPDTSVAALAPLQSSLQRLPAATRDKMKEDLAEQQTLKIHDESLGEVFASKIYQFVANGDAPLFGEPKKAMNDLVFVNDPTQNDVTKTTPLILSSGGISRGAVTDYNSIFRTSSLTPIPKKTSKMNIGWKSDGQNYVAKVDMEKVNPKAFFPKGPAPDYQALWSDKKLSGAVVVGDNMRDHPHVIDQYQEYYEKNGFKKTSETKIQNFDQYLLNQFKNGSLDYFVKEAHSDGDLENLFATAKTVTAKTFTKKIGDKEETVTLYFPDPKDPSHSMISNSAFGDAIKAREKNGKGELIYLNTSCWSEEKAKKEVLNAQSPKLVDISSTTMASMFSGGAERPIGRLLTGIRTEQSYQWMQDQVTQSAAGLQTDKYVIPGTKQYEEDFTKGGPQVNTQIQVAAVN